MADNVIRRDIVQIRWDVEDSPLGDLIGMAKSFQDTIKKSVSKSESELDDFNDSVQESTKNLKGLADTKINKLVTNVKKLKENVKGIAKTSVDKVKSGFTKLKQKLTENKKKSDEVRDSLKKINSISLKSIISQVTTLTSKLGKGLVTAAKTASRALAATFAAGAIGSFKLADMASDLNETVNKVEVSFGNNSKEVKNWSKNSIKNMGMAQQTALDMAAGFGDMGTSMGLSQSVAADMSMGLVQRAADLASFKNMELDEVNTALNGIFTGETESLKRLGVVMTQTNLEAFAKSQGKVLDEMSESEKVLLRYNYVLTKTSNSQGDFARTGGGFANQLRMAKEQLKQIGTTIGGTFIGQFEKGLKKFNNFATELNDTLNEVFADGFQFDDLAKITPMFGKIGGYFQRIAEKIHSIGKDGKKMEKIRKIFESVKKVAGQLLDIGTDLVLWIIDFATETKTLDFVEGVFNGIGDALEWVTTNFKNIKKWAIIAGGAILGVVGAAKGFKAFNAIKGFFGGKGAIGGESGGGFLNGIINMKSSTLLKGIGNISMILLALGGLVWIASKVFKDGIDIKTLFSVVAIIGALSLVGSGAAKLAGIVGAIPFMVVLTGLGNIALVIAGFGAIAVAFGALSKIDGFNDLIKDGGQVLITLCDILGNMVGAIVGGIGEGVTNSLPKIGKNLSAFAESLTPMFETFKGVDARGIGDFLTSFGAFMLLMTGEKILSFFTGGPDYATLGTQLTRFGENIEGFFKKVASFPANGFTNAKLLFESLADISNVPNTGGIAQWFSGTNDYESLAKGLNALSNDRVLNFYRRMNELPAECFSAVINFFKSLADIGNVPNTGGIGQWFSGKNNYAALAKGMEILSGERVLSFYRTMSQLPVESFTAVKNFFQSLADIGNIPNTGGIAQWFSGKNDYKSLAAGLKILQESVPPFYNAISTIDDFSKISQLFKALGSLDVENEGGIWGAIKNVVAGDNKNGIVVLGETLKSFGDNTAAFFTQVNGLNLDNLNGLWESLKKPGDITAATLEKVGQNMSDLVSDIQTKMLTMSINVTLGLNNLKLIIGSYSLESSGKNLINGLIAGMNSNKSAAVSAAREIAMAINREFDKIQDINSPSGVWEEKGKNLIQGGIVGMQKKLPDLRSMVQSIATWATPSIGVPSVNLPSYGPETSVTNSRSTSTQNNNYSPSFTLNMSGTVDRTTERTIKRWVKEALDEIFDSMSRTSPRVTEV